MRIRKKHASLALRLWILASVFVVLFLDGWEIVPWVALGAALGLLWKQLPDEPEDPPEKLPYQHLYEGRELPRYDELPPEPAAENPTDAGKKPD
jgi:hypothetical protein